MNYGVLIYHLDMAVLLHFGVLQMPVGVHYSRFVIRQI